MSRRLVLGPRAVTEAMRARASEVHAVYGQADARKALKDLFDEAQRRGFRWEERTKEDLDQLSEGQRHQGILAVVGPYPYASLEEILARARKATSEPLLLALDQVTDPHNFGAMVRSAVAFDVDGIMTLKHRAAPVTPVVVRASAGATEHARIVRVVNLARALDACREEGLSAVGLAAEGDVTIAALPPAPQGRVLVVGAEGSGLRRLVRERCDHLARIDHRGPVASLNASVATGIALFALRAKGPDAEVTEGGEPLRP